MVGERYNIRKLPTLDELFGSFADVDTDPYLPSGLFSASSTDADRLHFVDATTEWGDAWDITTAQLAPVFAGGDGWRKMGSSGSLDVGPDIVVPVGSVCHYAGDGAGTVETHENFCLIQSKSIDTVRTITTQNGDDEMVARLSYADSSFSITDGATHTFNPGDIRLSLS